MRAPKAALLICLLAAACAPAPGATAGAPANSQANASRRDRDPLRITMAEIRQVGATDALALVQQLRPQWLRDPISGDPGSMADDVVVYLDNTRMGGRAQLRQMQSRTIGRMEFVEGRIAARRWGVSHVLGAILVFTPTQADYEQQR